MRFAVLLAALATLWVQPAGAAVLVPNSEVNASAFGIGTRIDFELFDPLPAGAQINLPNFNQYFTHTLVWDGTEGKIVNSDPTKFDFTTRIVSQTATGFSIEYGFLGDYLDCNTGAVIGQVCGVYHEAFTNGSWRAVSTPDGNTDPKMQLNYNLAIRTGSEYNPTILPPPSPVPEPAAWALMILGIGIAGAAMRRRPAVRHGTLAAA